MGIKVKVLFHSITANMMRRLTPLQIINLLGHEPRRIRMQGELALKNKPIPIENDVLNIFEIGGKKGFTYLAKSN